MAQMIDAELDLEPVLGATGQPRDARVVDQQINTVESAADRRGRGADRRQVGQIEFNAVDRGSG